MRAPVPNDPCDFEIPDEWWIAAGMVDFTASQPAYRSTLGARFVSLRDIEPPHLDLAKPRDWCGFDRARMLRILSGMKEGAEIRPVPLLELADDAVPSSKCYASMATTASMPRSPPASSFYRPWWSAEIVGSGSAARPLPMRMGRTLARLF